MSLSHESAFAAGAVYSELTVLVRRQKVRLACSMVIFTVAEVVGLLLSMDKLRSEKRQEQEQETAVTPTEEVHDIESGVIEVNEAHAIANFGHDKSQYRVPYGK